MSKITNSALFRAMKWLTDNTDVATDEWLNTATSREIMDMYELRSGLYTVEYTSAGGAARWKGCTYDQAVRRTAAVVGLGYRPEIWRENDRECMTRQFEIPAWF